MSLMAILHNGPAPYAPIAHVLRAIDHYREKAPPTVTKELLMRLGYPDAYAVRTLKALRLLDLINGDGTPTDAFVELQRATTAEYTARLEQVIRTAYAEVFGVIDPATDSDPAIEDAFRFYTPLPQRDKMVTLFMGLCEAAGIIGAERAPKKRLRTVTGGQSKRKKLAEDGAPNPGDAGKHTPPALPPADPPGDAKPKTADPSSAEALRLRYVDMLMKKAEAQDDLDTGLLDRIEALLYEKRDDGERKD